MNYNIRFLDCYVSNSDPSLENHFFKNKGSPEMMKSTLKEDSGLDERHDRNSFLFI